MRHASFPLVVTLAAFLLAATGAGTLAAAPAAAPAAPAPRAAKAASGAVDLNSATEEQLQDIPGIGPALAKRIVEFRKQNGGFKTVEDLLKVRGIGEKSFEKLRAHVTVGK